MRLIENELVLPDSLVVDYAAKWQAAALVEQARHTQQVTNPAEQSVAVESARDIRTWVREVRAAGKSLRDPVNALAKEIKRVEDEHCAPLETEQERIERLVTDFQLKEARRVAEEERRRAEEVARLEAERLAREAQAVRAATDIKNEHQLNAAVALEEQAKAAEAKLQEAIAAPLPSVRKPTGATVKRVLRWECVDVHALYAARPELCKVEPRASAIQATCVPESPVPGLRLWWENQVSVRTR